MAQKIECSGAMLILLSPSHPLFDLVTQHHLFFIEERARCMARDQIMVAKGTMLTTVPLPKRVSKLFV